METKNLKIEYKPPGPVAAAYIRSDAKVKLIVGPVGSGKSVASLIYLWTVARMQTPGHDGIRRSRFIICRSTQPRLTSTTIKTFFEWVGKAHGKFTQDSPIRFHIQTEDIDTEFYFLALEKEEDVEKLKSLEATCIYFNEMSEIPKAIFDMATVRVGRYPNKMLAPPDGAIRAGIIADSNAVSTEHWIYKLFVEENQFELFHQPSGLSDNAENISALPKDYYQNATAGKDPDWVNVFVHAQWGHTLDGKAVYQGYRDRFHCSENVIEGNPNLGLFLGADFGLLTSACVIAQKTAEGRLIVLDEFTTENVGIQTFAERLSSYIATTYPGFFVAGAFADPAGGHRSMSNEETAFEIMDRNTEWKWYPAPGDNNILTRIECVRVFLSRAPDAQPALLISPKCKLLRAGFLGEYHFKTVKSGRGDVVHETPHKNHPFSDLHDALAYLCLGTGGLDAVLNRERRRSASWGDPIVGYDYGLGRAPDARPGKVKVTGVNCDINFDRWKDKGDF